MMWKCISHLCPKTSSSRLQVVFKSCLEAFLKRSWSFNWLNISESPSSWQFAIPLADVSFLNYQPNRRPISKNINSIFSSISKIKNPVDEGFDSKIIKLEFEKVYTSKLHVPKMMILSIWNFHRNFIKRESISILSKIKIKSPEFWIFFTFVKKSDCGIRHLNLWPIQWIDDHLDREDYHDQIWNASR